MEPSTLSFLNVWAFYCERSGSILVTEVPWYCDIRLNGLVDDSPGFGCRDGSHSLSDVHDRSS